MGLFSFAAGLFGGNSAKKASSRAEQAQLEYLNRAIALQEQQNQWAQSQYEPYLQSGRRGLDEFAASIGANGQAAQEEFLTGVQSSPVLAAAIRNGQEAILQNGSATGGIRGGNMQRGLADFNADQYVNEMMRQQQQLYALAGMGLGSTDSAVGFGQQSANNISNIYGQQGQVRAGGILTRGGITNQMWNNAGSFLDSAQKDIGKIAGSFF